MKCCSRILCFIVVSIGFLSCSKEELPNFDPHPNPNYEFYIYDALISMNMSRPKDSYNYPYLPKMEEWASFHTTQAMIDACQIPWNVLRVQSTQAVIQGIWEFPFFSETAFRPRHSQMDFDNIMLQLNVYQELITRDDACKCLYERYLLMPSFVEDCYFYSKAFEILLSQSVFLDQLSYDEKIEIVKEVFKKDEFRQQSEIAGSATREIAWFLIGRVMQNANFASFMTITKESETMREFLKTSKLVVYTWDDYANFCNSIILNGLEFINSKEI